ncbi:MAG TPA: CBS domain-containing protein, partial [Thermoanaerobaculia bacterium]|nr:CBS domain-containing protein [Thermoanaerobaculia bacterium]
MSSLPVSSFPSDQIRAAIESKDWELLRTHLTRLHPSDVADVIIDVPPEEEGIIFRLLPRQKAADVFAYLPPDHQRGLLKSISSEELKHVLDEVRPDDRTRLFEALPAEVTRRLLESLSPEDLKSARALLGYPENTAGRYMTPDYVALSPEMTAEEALQKIRAAGKRAETLNVLYIIDKDGRLIEDVRLGSLVLADPKMRVTAIPDPGLVAIQASADRSEVLQLFEKYDRVALPVV